MQETRISLQVNLHTKGTCRICNNLLITDLDLQITLLT